MTVIAGYLVGLPIAPILPLVTMGAVSGTAAAHATRATSTGARIAIGALVVALMLLAAFGAPLAVVGTSPRTGPPAGPP